jgi:hypothetical protein
MSGCGARPDDLAEQRLVRFCRVHLVGALTGQQEDCIRVLHLARMHLLLTHFGGRAVDHEHVRPDVENDPSQGLQVVGGRRFILRV